MPPSADDASARPQPRKQSYGEIYFISVQSGGTVYVGELAAKKFDPQLLASDRDVQFRLEGTTMYIKPTQGKEFATRIVLKIMKQDLRKQKP
jgi:hypothetical protein